MHNEEIERKMNFIVEQRAQFAADIQQLQESQARTEQVVARTVETVAQTSEFVAQTTKSVAQNLARTDENLRNLTATVDRYLREGRNGK